MFWEAGKHQCGVVIKVHRPCENKSVVQISVLDVVRSVVGACDNSCRDEMLKYVQRIHLVWILLPALWHMIRSANLEGIAAVIIRNRICL